MTQTARTRIAPGIYRDAYGYIVQPRLGSKKTIELERKQLRFPLDTPIGTVKAAAIAERAKLQAELNAWHKARHGTAGAPTPGSLAAAVIAYFLTATLSAKTRAWRETVIFPWYLEQFPNRALHTLEPGEIARALNGLRTVTNGHNKKSADGQPVARTYAPASASTKNQYRTALSHVFTVLHGKNGSNPIKDVPKYDEAPAAARDQPYELVDAILYHVRDRGVKKDSASLSKARLSVLAKAPVTPEQLWQLRRRDVDLERAAVQVPGRHKGAGTLPRSKPLTAEAIAAFRLFDAADAWQKRPARSSLARIFHAAKHRAIAELRQTRPDLDLSTAAAMRPYDMRHTFARFVLESTGDLETVRALLDHADRKTTERYAQGAIAPRLAIAGVQIAAAFAARPKYTPPPAPAPAPNLRIVARA